MHAAYVTAGTVGVGDLMHGLALRRAAERQGLPLRVTLVVPPSPFPAVAALDDVITIAVDIPPLLNPTTAPTTPLAEALRQLAPDVVVVGHFWAPLRHVLPALGIEAWLLLRKAPAAWVVGPPSSPFAPGHYARILEIEPVDFGVVGAEPWLPLVVANPSECLSRRDAREALGTDAARPLTLVFQAGNPGEVHQLRALAADQGPPGGEVLSIDLRTTTAPFPLATLLQAADGIVTGAGYNAFWESRWLGTATRTRFCAFPRRIDDQAWRLERCGGAVVTENGADRLARALMGR